ncbi:MAG: ABC transporter permease [Acidobacteriia bacterium]|nr:ABC transporter permease [Terriglobia bacterium]
MPGLIVSLFRNLFRKSTVERALDEELQSAAELLTEEKMKDGLSHSEARRHALIEIGGVEQVKEKVREIRVGRFVEDFARDLRFAVRTLAKSPGFTAVAVITLGLGIGANTAVFDIVREVVFSPRPYPHEKQVVQFYSQDKKHPEKFRLFSHTTYADIRNASAVRAVFSDVLSHNTLMVGLGEGVGSRRAFAAAISSNYFRTLEVPLAQGRSFLPEEEIPGSAVPVVIVSYLYWKHTGFDPQIIGKTIRVNERPFTVVGIAPEHFTGTMMLFGPELYFPLGDYDLLTNGPPAQAKNNLARRELYGLFVVGRLRSGVSMASGQAAIHTIAANLEKAMPVEQKDQDFLIRPLPRSRTSFFPTDERELTVAGIMLFSLGAAVLFIACLNLASVLLARGLARRKEISIRLAIGGGRGRIIRQLLTEGLVLSLGGGVGGFLISLLCSDWSAASLSAHIPVPMTLTAGTNVAAITATLGFCALATLFFALGPAVKLTRADLVADLKEQAGEDLARRRHRWLPRHPLVVVQIALSLGLLTAAGLFIRGALKAGNVETGFQTADTVLVEADTSLVGYDQTRTLQLYRDANERLASLPGVQSASIASTVPFGMLTINRPVQRAGVTAAPDYHPATAAEGLAFNVRWSSVGADFFRAMGLPMLRGRAFTKNEAEIAGSPPVAIVDEVLAKKLWPEGDALGRRIQWAETGTPTAAGGGGGTMGRSNDVPRSPQDSPSMEIVGIVPATRWELFQSEIGGQIFVPFAQGIHSDVFFQVRARADARADDATLFDLLRREIRSAAPGVPVLTVRTFGEHVDTNPQLWIVRSGAGMVSLFAGLALTLAVIGIYGVMAYAVARRTREIGIRRALGAAPAEVLRMILREGLVTTCGGIALGVLLALGIGRAFSSMLFEVSPLDPVAFTLAPAVIVATALAACWLPARRAMRVDPIAALRCE